MSSKDDTTDQIAQQTTLAVAVAEIRAMRREHNTSMEHVNTTLGRLDLALRDIFAWQRDMDAKHTEGVRHCSSHDSQLQGHEKRLDAHDRRIDACEARHDDSSTEELAAAVAARLPLNLHQPQAPESGTAAAFAKPSTILSLGLIAAGLILLVVLLSVASGRRASDITPPIPMPAGEK